jgi:hypothetical protein
MIHRNEISFNIVAVFNQHRIKSDVIDPDYVQYPHAVMERMEWKGTFFQIRFS